MILLGALPSRAGEADWAADPIHVYYDGDDCGTDQIEVEVWDRKQGAWRAHPRHVRVRVPSCQLEDAGNLWNELRWRCAPASSDASPPWRSFDVFDAEVMSRCAVDQIASGAHRTAISVTSPAEGALVRAPEPFVNLAGSVDVDGLAGSEYDVVLLVDRTVAQAALTAQIEAARAFVRELAPRLGVVRIAVLSYPHPEHGPGESTGARREIAWSGDAAAIDRALARVPARPLVVSRSPVPEALDAALELLESVRPAARRTIVIGVNGERLDSPAEPAPGEPLLRAAERVAARGGALHWIALGGLAPDDPVLVRRALANARGSFRRVPPHAYATRFLDGIPLPVAEAVWIEAGAPGKPTVPASLDAHGRFSARVPVSTGANALVIHARTSDGAVALRPFALVFDDAWVNKKILEAERERIRAIRAAQRKRLELRPEPETP